MSNTTLYPCECEHVSHFEHDKRSPNGNPTHKYGQKFYEHHMTIVKTEYGTFHVCKDCANDCHQSNNQPEEKTKSQIIAEYAAQHNLPVLVITNRKDIGTQKFLSYYTRRG
jgi:hypothetical protein